MQLYKFQINHKVLTSALDCAYLQIQVTSIGGPLDRRLYRGLAGWLFGVANGAGGPLTHTNV